MLDEIKVLEPQLKQIVYGCVEHVQATKAALYLSASLDLNEKVYEIATGYQFHDPMRRTVKSNDDLVDRLVVKRNAFYVNGLGSDQRFSEMLFRQGTDRLLATPIFARGRLVGFLDLRDKAAKKPFDAPDLDAARKIAEQIIDLLGSRKLFGLAPIPLSALSAAEAPPAPRMNTPMPFAPMTAAQPQMANAEAHSELSAAARKAIESAREAMSRKQHTAANAGKRLITDEDLEGARLLLPAALAVPGALLAALTATRNVTEAQTVVATTGMTADANDALQKHIRGWLERANQPQLNVPMPRIAYPFGTLGESITAARIGALVSAPIQALNVDGLVVFTVALAQPPDTAGQRALRVLLRQIEQSIESASGGARDRQRIAEKLLEPDFQRYPDLVEHCREVSTLAQRFANALDLPAAQVETIRLAALVHDVGLRLIDYDRLYRRPNLLPEELRAMSEHPIVGAAIVEPLLGNEIAQAVLRHHERVDGRGYPSRLAGNAIPLASRVLQICDAYIAMSSRGSYQAPFSAQDTRKRLLEGAGTQFDDALVQKFIRFLPVIAP
jgi:HD-GYP domain-containing protein (c-di-GMP phosphodiesterase class II)